MRWKIWVCSLIAAGACASEEPLFIPGSATLPDCSAPPAVNLDGTEWFDQGTVTVTSAGCQDASAGDPFAVCALNWDFTQRGDEVSIVVDDEYRLQGRLCGDQLHLRGGWWLPVEDAGQCTYDDDSAMEVGLQAAGNVLTVTAEQLTGTLALRAACDATYEVVFARVPTSR
jgi:hypothetical protein